MLETLSQNTDVQTTVYCYFHYLLSQVLRLLVSYFVKIWDVVTGNLKLTLTGHIEQIRGLVPTSSLLPFFFVSDCISIYAYTINMLLKL